MGGFEFETGSLVGLGPRLEGGEGQLVLMSLWGDRGLQVQGKLNLLLCKGFSGDFPGGSEGKESVHNAGDLGLILGSGRSPGEGNGYPLQYSCLQNSMDRGA